MYINLDWILDHVDIMDNIDNIRNTLDRMGFDLEYCSTNDIFHE